MVGSLPLALPLIIVMPMLVSYPAAVLVISLMLAALWRLVRHPATRRLDDVLPRRYPPGVAAVAWLVIVAWIHIGGPLLALPAAVLAPPLFVSVLEWLGPGNPSAGDGLRRWALLVGAALFGSVTARWIPIGAAAGVVASARRSRSCACLGCRTLLPWQSR